MDAISKPGKYTGSSQPTPTVIVSESAPVESTGGNKASPVLSNVPSKVESMISTGEVSVSILLAIGILLADFKALQGESVISRLTSWEGKIYWSVEIPGHLLALEDGKLLVDGEPAENAIEKLLK